MKKILAVSLISIMALTVFTSCESAKVTESSVTTETTEEEIEDTTSTTSTTTEETTIETATESTTEVTTIETVITTAPTETSYLYDPENRPISVNWDKLGDKQDNSVNSIYKRLSEEPILKYEPGTANGCIFPYVGSITSRVYEVFDEAPKTLTMSGFVDTLGTIVCDPVYSHMYTGLCDRIYVTEREENGIKYVGLIYKDGSKSIEVPYSFYQCSEDFIYIHNNETGTLQIYDTYCNMVAESPRLPIQLNEGSGGYSTNAAYYTYYDYENDAIDDTICLLTGNTIDVSVYPWDCYGGYYDDLIFYDIETYSMGIYDAALGMICELGKYTGVFKESNGYYLARKIDSDLYDLISPTGEITELDSKDCFFVGDKLFVRSLDNKKFFIGDYDGYSMKEYPADKFTEDAKLAKAGRDKFIISSNDAVYCYDYEMNLLYSKFGSFQDWKIIYDFYADEFYYLDGNEIYCLSSDWEIEIPDLATNKEITQIVYGNVLVKEWETDIFNNCSKMYSLLYDSDDDLMFVYEAYAGDSFIDD